MALPFSALLGLGAWLAVIIGCGRPGGYPWSSRTEAGLWGLWAVLLGLSVVTAGRPGDAFLGIWNFLPFVLLYATGRRVVTTAGRREQLAWLWLGTSGVMALIALGQRYLGWRGQLLGLVDWTPESQQRVDSLFIDPNIYACYAVLSLAVGLGLAAHVAFKVGWRAKAFAQVMGLLLLNMGGLLLTRSINGLVMALLTAGLGALLQGWVWLVGGVSLVGLGIGGAALGPPWLHHPLRGVLPAVLWQRLADYPTKLSQGNSRVDQWLAAWSLSEARPWTGWGLRNFPEVYRTLTGHTVNHPHNLVVMLIVETGRPAALLLVGLVGWQVYRGSRCLSRQDPLFTGFWLAFVATTLFQQLDVPLFDSRINALGWLLLGITAGRADAAERHASMPHTLT